MASWDEVKNEIRSSTDFVALVSETVQLKRRGKDFWGCCPFHQEKSPSFHVSPDTGLWKCFGCGKGGDIFDYVMERENLDFADAVRYLADRAGIEMPTRGASSQGPKRSRLKECLAAAQNYFATMLMRSKGDDAAAARAYLSQRGYGSDVCQRWGLGYAPGHGTLVRELRQKGFSPAEIEAANLSVVRSGHVRDTFYDRVMFPIADEHGQTIAFSGRYLGDYKAAHTGKYINSAETSVFSKKRNLYAFDRAKENIIARSEVVVCEGYTDVISMHEAGFTQTVATMGTALTAEHMRLLERCSPERIICMFDGDAAGQKAAERALQFLEMTHADMLCVVLPDDLDPADFLRERGADAMQAELKAACRLADFVYEKRMASLDLSTPGARAAALDEMAGVLAPLKHSFMLDEYATSLAQKLHGNVEEIKRRIREKPIETYADDETLPSAPAALEASLIGSWDILSADDRQQLILERELLTLMARRPDLFRSSGDRIGGFSWSDSRHEAIAWAILATPTTATPAEVVAAAEEVEPAAKQILAAGRWASDTTTSDEYKRDFLLDVVDLYSCRRQVISARAALASSTDNATSTELFRVASTKQEHMRELTEKLRDLAQSQNEV